MLQNVCADSDSFEGTTHPVLLSSCSHPQPCCSELSRSVLYCGSSWWVRNKNWNNDLILFVQDSCLASSCFPTRCFAPSSGRPWSAPLHLPAPAIFATFPYNYFTIMHQTRHVPSLCCLAMMELIFKYTDNEKKEKPHHLDREVKMLINPIPDGYQKPKLSFLWWMCVCVWVIVPTASKSLLF